MIDLIIGGIVVIVLSLLAEWLKPKPYLLRFCWDGIDGKQHYKLVYARNRRAAKKKFERSFRTPGTVKFPYIVDETMS